VTEQTFTYQAEQATEAARQLAETTVEAVRVGLPQSGQVSRQVLDVWAAGTEATLKATFELQNAAIATGRALFGGAEHGELEAIRQMADVVQQAQRATLDAWQASLNAAARLMSPTGK